MIAPFFKTIARNFRYANIEKISPIPLLIIHGDNDRIVPVHHSSILYDEALEPKELWIAKGAGHIWSFADEDIRKRFTEYLKNH